MESRESFDSISDNPSPKEDRKKKDSEDAPTFWRDKVDFDEADETEKIERLGRKVIILDPALNSKVENKVKDGSITSNIDKQLAQMNLCR